MPRYTNRLDNLPYDCLQYVLSFCGDNIQFDFKKNVIFSNSFQDKLKPRFLSLEYGEDEDIEDEEVLKMKRMCEYLFSSYPVSSFEINYNEYGLEYEININYRKCEKDRYKEVIHGRTLEFKTTEELDEEVREQLNENQYILYIEFGIIYDNVYNKIKQKLSADDIEELQQNGQASVLEAITDMEELATDVIRYGGYEGILQIRYMEEVGDDTFLIEREH